MIPSQSRRPEAVWSLARHAPKTRGRVHHVAKPAATQGGVEFVPFSIEAGGIWGPAARKFFRECLALADDDRDIDLYHWSSARFSAVWRDTLSVLVARGRAQVSVAAAVADWPKRIRDMRYLDHEDSGGTD